MASASSWQFSRAEAGGAIAVPCQTSGLCERDISARKVFSCGRKHARDRRRQGGSGGVDGFDAAPVKLGWKSSQHAIDLMALFGRLADAKVAGDWREHAAHARRFLDSRWYDASGHFLIGTLPNGRASNRATSALDVQWR